MLRWQENIGDLKMIFIKRVITRIIPVFMLLTLTCYAADSLTDPREILLKHYEAVGGLEKLKKIKSGYIEGKTTFDGLEGRFRTWEEIPLKYRLEEDYTVIKQVFGDDGEVSWSVDTNGKVQIHRDEETIKRRKVKALLEVYDHMEPDTKNFILTYQGDRQAGRIDCHLVKMANIINDDYMLFFINKDNYYAAKTILKQPDVEIHTLYSDYRRIDGILLPFHEETEILPREKKETVQLERYDFNVKTDRALFEPPAKDIEDFEFANNEYSSSISFTFIENNVYLPVTINGESRLWLLDNGASMSIIDADYANKLGLTPEGEIKGFGIASVFDFSFVTLPGYQVGDIHFNSQKIFSYKGLSDRLYDSGVVGIMGHDFLSRFVVKIDYASGILSFYHPDRFEYKGEGRVVDAPLRNKIFSLPAIVDGKYEGRWTLDIGAFDVSFHYPYAKENGLLEKKGVERISADLGGQHGERTVRFRTMELGGYKVLNPLINIPLIMGKGSNVSREIIGNIGNTLLRHFTVYLDYKRQRVIIEKGKDFDRGFPEDKSGMLIGITGDGHPEIVFVAPGTPADKAGFVNGDIIQKINGKDAGSFGGIIGVRNLFLEGAGKEYNIEVIRAGSRHELKLILEDLFK
ncbi:MAG: PDZ domain-containing protein [Desulfobacteraceae bacterium]|nr:MAG: PDZ domain-containing protein [Desulfobacteraceae bacterium]